MQSEQDRNDPTATESQSRHDMSGASGSRSAADHPRRIACCEDPAATSRGGNNYCASCGRRTNYQLRQAMFHCSHEGGKHSFTDSPEKGCLHCGLRFCITDDCNFFACDGGNAGYVLTCTDHGAHAT
ncbi:hypothetical protein AB0C84_42825 [Actinomadura sp. NPDC048955]|uniref:hypothetical protein n=1 Tax=Actinomadura sp. NPDC048955 TaxID=3158228 RepID=UPI0033C69ED2